MKAEELKYTETHEWIYDDGSGVLVVGVSEHAAEQLSDIAFVGLPTQGQKVEAGGEIGEIETVKAVSPVYSPISGEVVEVNKDLPDNPDWLSDDPLGKGWLFKVQVVGGVPDSLLDWDAYQKQCAEEE